MTAHRTFLTVVSVFVAFVLVGVGFIAYRSFANDYRCVAIHGSGWHWTGEDLCIPPAVHTPGLL